MVHRLKVSLNGDREPSEHPAIPITPAELAAAARAAVDAGAEAVHLHPRDAGGQESLVRADIAAAVGAVRVSCPGTPIGVSTGLWIAGGDVDQRLTWVTGWAELGDEGRPDFASVNLSEGGAAALVKTLTEIGIGPEAGVWSTADVHALMEIGDAVTWTRILVEIRDSPSRPEEEADRLLIALADVGHTAPVLLHGEQETCWPVLRHAGRLGLPTRIGLEDVLVGPSGGPVSDNAVLVGLALQEWEAVHKPRNI